VGATGWTIVVIRTARGEELFSQIERAGQVDVRSIDEFERSKKIMLQLSRKKKERVPIPPGKDEFFIREPLAK
jgi:coenzyme F420-reducing hydrogenase beta subunit